jgi:2,4-dienoyl-CoA reductase-like NADH-dependent reductase (Old Yellow Enzyme family)
MSRPVQVKGLETVDAFRGHAASVGADLPFDAEPDVAVLRRPVTVAGRACGNRFAVLPMEGWDGTEDGRPSDLVRRRWSRFGTSGAGLVWGGEAYAVCPDGRANPHQLCRGPSSARDLAELRGLLDDDQVTGLQLTHSGRWSLESRPARRDPLLDQRRSGPPLTDAELDALADDYVATAALAQEAGFDFVDVKACHGYLLHELLSGHERDGPHGGDLAGRSLLLRTVIERVRELGMPVGVRLSVFDVVPHRAGPDGVGEPEADVGDAFGFDEPLELLELLDPLGVDLVCVTAGSPYYSPHVQRPAYFPPSDGYRPPEEPLVGVARLLDACSTLAAARPDITFVATGLTYLQEWVPNVASALVRQGGAALVGLGRMALSYPDLPADVLAGRIPDRRRLCRTFSDCTTAPRNGLVSGCWPLDDHYRQRSDRVVLAAAKKRARG